MPILIELVLGSFCFHRPLKRTLTLLIEATWIPFTEECAILSVIEIGELDVEKKILDGQNKVGICVKTVSESRAYND